MSVRGMRMRMCAAMVLALVLGAAVRAEAGIDEAGTTAANFLTLGSGARTLGMGGATLGLGEDVASSAWNAAALGWMRSPQVALSHAGLANKSLQEWGAYGGRLGQTQTRWAVSGLYQGESGIEGRDASGLSTGTLSVGSVALGAMVAQQVGERVTVGFGTKYVHEKLGDVSGGGFTFDGGLMVRQGGFGLGVSGQNVLGQMRYSGAIYQFPTNYGAGVSYTHAASGLKVAVDANLPKAYHPDVRVGMEWTYRGMAAFRSGYRKELGSAGDPLSGASFGLGAGHNGMWMDYGYLVAGQGEHRLGLRFQMGGSGDNVSDRSDRPAAASRPARGHGDFEKANDNALIGPPVPSQKKKR